MCDTLVALGDATQDGSIIFAKNSDRKPNEAHQLVMIPSQDYEPGSEVHCTYRSIPQVEHTYKVFLAKPFWIWGAEMGANEQGVVIGNEALFTKAPYGKEPGLIGMDYLRLGLERAATARRALEVIVQLLENYGQSGDCGYGAPFYYHNSFLIVDKNEAWVLETVDRQWAAVKVQGVRSISNGLTIGSEWDLASDHLIDYGVKNRWCKKKEQFHLARCLSEPVYTFFSDSMRRQACTQSTLEANRGNIQIKMVMDLLRSHGDVDPEHWRPDVSLVGNTVCMHAAYGPIRMDQSVGSMVTQIRGDMITHWVTGTSAPCTSIFKPVRIPAGLPDIGPLPTAKYDPNSLFWRHERFHRAILQNPSPRLKHFQGERDALETRFINQESEWSEDSPGGYLDFSQECFREADQAEEAWYQEVSAMPVNRPASFYYQRIWRQNNLEAGVPETD